MGEDPIYRSISKRNLVKQRIPQFIGATKFEIILAYWLLMDSVKFFFTRAAATKVHCFMTD